MQYPCGFSLRSEVASTSPDVGFGDALTPERLHDMRSALALPVDAPLVTLQAHVLSSKQDTEGAVALAGKPLAKHLTELVTRTVGTSATSDVTKVATSDEVLYRMVVPAKLAAKVASGVVKPMMSKSATGGILSTLRIQTGIVGAAQFVPVSAAAAGGGAAGAAEAAVTAATGGAIAASLTVAAPLMLMAVAVGASAYAENQRQQAIENLTILVEALHIDALEKERSELDGCRDALDKASAILLDQGRLGVSLGLDSAVYAINTAIAQADRRLKQWTSHLDAFAGQADLAMLDKVFPGIDGDRGTFRAHLELAALAIASKRRVDVLQAVEHGQSDEENRFENFVRTLKTDEERINALEAGIASVLVELSNLRITAPKRARDRVMMRSEVDHLLDSVRRVHEVGADIQLGKRDADVVVDIARHADGSIDVFPAEAIESAQ